MIPIVPFCFEYLLKLREKVRGNLVCCLMWGYPENTLDYKNVPPEMNAILKSLKNLEQVFTVYG